jgi:D-alanyl-D-alanine carboxypeptidase/D-alanyl-D-alanine-endopeptidase (penicillin-binding protein 4)
VGPELLSQLSIAGVDGTMRGRLRSWGDERAVRAKTGTLASTVALTGYVLRPDGRRPMVFSAIVSDCRGKTREARDAIDAFVDALARSAWGR